MQPFSELTKHISQQRRDQIEKRKQEIRAKWGVSHPAPLENKTSMDLRPYPKNGYDKGTDFFVLWPSSSCRSIRGPLSGYSLMKQALVFCGGVLIEVIT